MIAILFPLLAALVVSFAARAHGPEVQWIMDDERYVREAGYPHCCGPKDCRRLNPGEAMTVPGGYMILATGQFIAADWRALYRSIDEDFYGCFLGDRKTVACLFAPAAVGS